MRTEYALYRWRTDGGTAEKPVQQYVTIAEAQTAAGYPNQSDWQETPSGGWGLADGIQLRLGFYVGQPFHIAEVQIPESDAERIQLAITLGFECGGYGGDHHKQWTIDQMIRLLAGDRYEVLVAEHRAGEDGPDTYTWDEGIAP